MDWVTQASFLRPGLEVLNFSLTASGLPPAPNRRADAPNDEQPSERADGVDDPSVQAPRRNERHPNGDSRRSRQIPALEPVREFRRWERAAEPGRMPARKKRQEKG